MGERERCSQVLAGVVLALLLLDGAVSKTYNTGAKPVPGKLNVHLVPHTHDDLGWLETPDQYYVGPDTTNGDFKTSSAVKYIIHTVIQELEDDPNRKFSYAETGFFIQWWREQTAAKQIAVEKLVASGQLEFINGGWCMHDEAATHYVDMIDQTTLGHRYLKSLFGITPRNGWQIDPFGHSAVQAYLLSAEAGFDSMFVARIDYQDKEARIDDRSLEMIWRGSETLGSSAEIFMGVFPSHYNAPPTFNFEVDGSTYEPVQDDSLLEGLNVQQRVNDLVQLAQQQASITRTNHIMWTMGDDFTYQTASTWFSPMDKLIHYANLDGRVNVLYSNPSIYLDSKNAANKTWPLKTGDFYPYATSSDRYWTGYFTSRPGLKGYVRQMSGYLQAARQMEFLVGRKNDSNTDSLEEAMATAQHHDGVSGTSKQVVADDYALHLYRGSLEAESLINDALKSFTGGDNLKSTFQQCGLLNVTYCPASEAAIENGSSLVVVAYNSLSWSRVESIRIPVSSDNLTVTDSKGNIVASQILPVSNATKNLRKFYVEANLGVVPRDGHLFDLVFQASVPPLGFTSFTVGPATSNSSAAEQSVVETQLQSNTANNTTMQIGNGILDLTFSDKTGQLISLYSNKTGTKVNVSQTNLWYESEQSISDTGQSSGAYVFLPADDSAQPVNSANSSASWTLVQGSLVQEVQQVFSPWVSQVTRVHKDQDHVEVEFTVGPIPVDDNIGKEVITRLSTSIASDSTFYTDSNGRDFIKRVRDYRDSWNLTVVQPVAGNYYPLNLGMYISDGVTDFSVLVDRAVGGASIKDGQLEVMLHRRILADDGFGVDEALNEQVCTDSSICEGLTIHGRYLISAKPTADAAEWRRTRGQALLSPLLLAFTTNEDSNGSWEASHTAEFSAMASSSSLPPNVALTTLQELDMESVLLRLAHLYQANEHPELSKLATVELEDLFPTRKIAGATEMGLTANQEKSNIKKLKWSVEGDDLHLNQTNVVRGSAFNSSSLRVELGPMEIRTFILNIVS